MVVEARRLCDLRSAQDLWLARVDQVSVFRSCSAKGESQDVQLALFLCVLPIAPPLPDLHRFPRCPSNCTQKSPRRPLE